MIEVQGIFKCTFMDIFMYLCQVALNPGFFASFVVALFLLTQGTFYACQLLFILFMISMSNSLLKFEYAEPRPFWYEDVEVFGRCSHQYGMPSGHMNGYVAAFGYLLHVFISYRKGLSGKSWSDKWSIVATALFFVFLLLCAMCRIYLGKHFIYQVFYGSMYGAVLCMMFIILDKVMAYQMEHCDQRWSIVIYSAIPIGLQLLALLQYTQHELQITPQQNQ